MRFQSIFGDSTVHLVEGFELSVVIALLVSYVNCICGLLWTDSVTYPNPYGGLEKLAFVSGSCNDLPERASVTTTLQE